MPTIEEMQKQIMTGAISLRDIKENGWLCSVTQRIDKIKQPRGGYLKPSTFKMIQLDNGTINDLHSDENIHASLIGLAVDYLTRYMSGTSAQEAFSIAHRGSVLVGEEQLFEKLISRIDGLTDESISSAVILTGFDSAYRAGVRAYRPVQEIVPDTDTIENIRTMVERSLNFFALYGPKVLDGLTFTGGYTGYVSSGDGDFLTKDTLWDFKVSKYPLKSKHTLQLLMYWRMGVHSIHKEYQSVRYLGVYNPRMNIVYRLSIDKISQDVIDAVERDVIGY